MHSFPAYYANVRRTPLDLFSGGTYTRSGDALYLTDEDSYATATANQRRIEYDPNLPGGTGLLFEGSRANFVRYSQPAPAGTWATSVATLNYLAVDGPLGTATAAELILTANPIARVNVSFTATVADSAVMTVSCWARVPTGTGTFRLGLRQKDSATFVWSSDFALDTTWRRFEAQLNVGVGAGTPFLAVGNGTDGVARTIHYTLAQAELSSGAVATSPILVPGTGTVTRPNEVLSFAAGQYPAQFVSTGMRLLYAPTMSSAEYLAASSGTTDLNLVAWNSGTSDRCRITVSGGTARVQLVQAAANMLLTPAVTWARGSVLSITMIPSLGRLVLSGFSSGNGTFNGFSFTWAGGQLNIGNYSGGSSSTACYGRFGRYIEVA